MGLAILLAVQVLATLVGVGLLWRRLDIMGAEMRALRDELAARGVRRAAKAPVARSRVVEAVLAQLGGGMSAPPRVFPDETFPDETQPSGALFESDWPRAVKDATPLASIEDDGEDLSYPPSLSPETARLLVVVAALIAPAIGLYFAAPLVSIVSAGLVASAAALLVSLRSAWRQTAWCASLAGGVWALVGLLTNIGYVAAPIFAVSLALGAFAGLAHARLQAPATPGAALTLFMATAAITLGAQIGMVSAAGIGFGVIAMACAAVSASALRLEPMHLASFAGAGLGLYLLSGQDGGDIWFTPAAAWAGAVFLGLAFVRAPSLGPRGTVIAATGAIAPIFALGAMYTARHGLENPLAAAAAFAALALVFAAILALSVRRHASLAALHLTLWALSAAAIGAAATACVLAAQAPLEPTALAALALGLIAIDQRWPDRVWRFGAIVVGAIALVAAWRVAGAFVAVDTLWPPILIAAFSFAAPPALAGAAAHLATRRAPITSAVLEAGAIAGGAVALSAVTRLAFSTGAPALQPISFVEAGIYVALWLLAALALAARADKGAAQVRRGAAVMLVGAALGVSVICVLMGVLERGAGFYMQPGLHAPFAFAAPALAAWAHWAYWRWRDAPQRTRVALAIASGLSAAWLTLEVAWLRGETVAGDWVTPVVGAALFAAAAGINFIPQLISRIRAA